jgi:serine/threonine protein kinase
MPTTPTLAIPGYEVIQFLGSGARSTIWQVRDRQEGRMYALKRVVKRNAAEARYIEQALNEHEIGSRLDHPCLRRIHRLMRVRRWLRLREVHVLMELCEGTTVQESRPDCVRRVLRIFGEVASALAYMNAQGYVHADMKPNNIIVSPAGDVKVIDLGQSCPLGTVKTRIQGTPDFISPEQVHRRPVDARTDVFNFGAALYWSLTGRPLPTVPLKDRPAALKNARKFTPVEHHNPAAPSSLTHLVADCTEAHPTNRPSSMNEVASRLGLIGRQLARSDGGDS